MVHSGNGASTLFDLGWWVPRKDRPVPVGRDRAGHVTGAAPRGGRLIRQPR